MAVAPSLPLPLGFFAVKAGLCPLFPSQTLLGALMASQERPLLDIGAVIWFSERK